MQTNNSASTPIWSRDFTLAVVINFALAGVFYLLMTTMALYAVDRFRAHDALAGLTAGAYVLGAVVSRLLTSKYLDLVGRRRTVLVGLVAFVVLSVLYLVVTDLTVLIALRFLHGVAFGGASTAVAASALMLVPREKRAEGSGYFSISATLAAGIGPLIGTLVIHAGGYEGIFWVSTGLAILGLTGALFIRLPEREPSEEEIRTRWRIRLSDLIDARAMPISIMIFLGCFAWSGVLAFYLNYADATGTAAEVGAFFTIYAITVFVVRLFAGRLQDRFGDNAVFYPSFVIFAVGLVVIAIPPSLPVAITGAVLTAIGFGSLMPGGQAVAVTVVPPERVAVATSTYFVMADAAIGVGPILLGLLLPLTGYDGMYLLLAAFMVLTIGVYAMTHGRRRVTAAA
ncbi:MFS transporter [Salinibacterium sp. dk2585]|uniref:MFS transporter n=1 Tax=unclassified Salinibacterium TaxID=2632331 RepID=UPI0011C254A2|nr:MULTISPECIES: MFS transporter [unclassified Salinibacterium]QEE60222.1 MFS transporter [Salinibacterium sp. dk2585]TXK55294.1 MFS transporter [Salinibacterium sp. dk5596]